MVNPLAERWAQLQALPGWDAGCALLGAVIAVAWIKVWDRAAQSGAIERTLSRKLVHATAAPLFLATWPLFRWGRLRRGGPARQVFTN
jgi:hypothetical protein